MERVFPMARATDPNTSHAAAKQQAETKLSERRHQCLEIVEQSPGLTSGEISRRFLKAHPELSIVIAAGTPSKRLPELLKLGLVRHGENRKCGDSGYVCMTWYPCNRPEAPKQERLF